MICPKCRKIYNSRQVYCISCGAELVEDDAAAEENVEISEASDVPNVPDIKGLDEYAAESDTNNTGIFPDAPESDDESGEYVRDISLSVSPHETGDRIALNVKERKPFSASRALKSIASVCLSLLLAVSTAMCFGTAAARVITDKKNTAEAARNLDLLSVPMSDLGLDEVYGFSGSDTVEEAVAAMAAGSGVDSGNIRKIYENSTLKEFVSEAATEYTEYLRNGTEPERITAERIKSLFTENVSVISSNTGTPLSDADIDLAYSEIERSAELLSGVSVNSFESGSAGGYIRAARAYMSLPALIAEIAAAAVITALLAALNRNFRKTLQHIGVPILAVGALALAVTFMFSMQVGIFSGFTGLSYEVIKAVSGASCDNLYRISAAMLFTGAAAVVVSKVNV